MNNVFDELFLVDRVDEKIICKVLKAQGCHDEDVSRVVHFVKNSITMKEAIDIYHRVLVSRKSSLQNVAVGADENKNKVR